MPGLMTASQRQVYDRLNARIRAAHAAGHLQALAAGYAEGGALYDGQGETDAACFFWTQAYVFALDAGDEHLATTMHERLSIFDRMG
ncbi:MAG: hypothetical protein R3F54_09880 [Alphaproteobacteria bacterium]